MRPKEKDCPEDMQGIFVKQMSICGLDPMTQNFHFLPLLSLSPKLCQRHPCLSNTSQMISKRSWGLDTHAQCSRSKSASRMKGCWLECTLWRRDCDSEHFPDGRRVRWAYRCELVDLQYEPHHRNYDEHKCKEQMKEEKGKAVKEGTGKV